MSPGRLWQVTLKSGSRAWCASRGAFASGADQQGDCLLPCRLRQLTMKLEPFVTARPWPKAVKHGPGEGPPEGTSHLYFLGVRKKQQQMSATTYQRSYQRNVNLNVQVECAVGLLLVEQSAEVGPLATRLALSCWPSGQQRGAQGAAAPASACWAVGATQSAEVMGAPVRRAPSRLSRSRAGRVAAISPEAPVHWPLLCRSRSSATWCTAGTSTTQA